MKIFRFINIILLVCLSYLSLHTQSNCSAVAVYENAVEVILDPPFNLFEECTFNTTSISGKSVSLMSYNSFIEKNKAFFISDCITPNLHVVWHLLPGYYLLLLYSGERLQDIIKFIKE